MAPPRMKKKPVVKKKAGGARRKPLKTKRPRKKVGKRKAVRSWGVIRDNPEAQALALEVARAVIDKKGTDVVVLDVRGKASYADYIVVASADSERLVNALAEGVEDRLRPLGKRPLGREGEETGTWVLLDYGEVVAHLFHTDARGFYDLEGLWADAPRERLE